MIFINVNLFHIVASTISNLQVAHLGGYNSFIQLQRREIRICRAFSIFEKALPPDGGMWRLLPAALLWAQFLALGLFLYGFFPIKNSVGKDDRGGGGAVDWPSRGETRHWWVTH